MAKRRSEDERAIAAAKLVYREGITDEAIRRTAIYAHLRECQAAAKQRRKRLAEDRKERQNEYKG